MKRSGTIGFVWGYLPGVDIRSDVAAEAGLMRRFSVAFDRYPDSAPGMYDIEFNKEVAVGVLRKLIELFPHDSLVATDLKGETHDSLEGACLYDAEDEVWEPIQAVRLTKNGKTVCYVEHESYQLVGGPGLYHDAFVYAFYCGDIDRGAVQKALFSHALANGITILDVVSGSPEPVKVSRLKRFFGRMG